MLVAGTEIFSAGTDQPVVGQLLAHMGSPTRHPAAGENGREKVRRNSQIVVSGSGVEIHVRQEPLFLLNHTVNNAGHLEPFGIVLHFP